MKDVFRKWLVRAKGQRDLRISEVANIPEKSKGWYFVDMRNPTFSTSQKGGFRTFSCLNFFKVFGILQIITFSALAITQEYQVVGESEKDLMSRYLCPINPDNVCNLI